MKLAIALMLSVAAFAQYPSGGGDAGGGGAPAGSAGGCLAGTYPNPSFSGVTTAGGIPYANSTPCLTQDPTNFFYDATNKRLQVGIINSSWTGYEQYMSFSVMKDLTVDYATYQDVYGQVVQMNHDSTGLGTTEIDLYGAAHRARIQGNGTYSAGATGSTGYADAIGTVNALAVIGASGNAVAAGSSVVSNVYGGFYDAKCVQTSTCTSLYGAWYQALRQNTATITNSYAAYFRSTSGATNNWNLYSQAGTGTQARNYFGGPTGIGPGNDAPTNTLDVKDSTAVTGATRAVIAKGAADTPATVILSSDAGARFNHILAATAVAPTIASGFGTSPAIAGGDAGGRITVGTGGSALTGDITFGTAYGTAPACIVNNETTQLAAFATATTTTLTIASSVPWTAADKLTWVCIGY